MLLIFDWDGTLVDSRDHIVSAMQGAMAQQQLPVKSESACARMIGLSLVDIFERFYTDQSSKQCAEFIESYSSHFAALAGTGFSSLFSNIESTLIELKQRGHALAVATGKSRRGLNIGFESTGISHLFMASRTADETAPKPSPKMIDELLIETGYAKSDVVMIGDTSFDLDMASRAGVKSVGVSYGVHSVDDLEVHNPLCIVECPLQLLELALLD